MTKLKAGAIYTETRYNNAFKKNEKIVTIEIEQKTYPLPTIVGRATLRMDVEINVTDIQFSNVINSFLTRLNEKQ